MSAISNSWNKLFNNIMNYHHYNNHSNNHSDLKLDNLYGLENKRIDYRHLNIYSIDPPKCSDADDAFSIYKDGDNIHLLIHIADPTSYFNPNDKLFDTIYTMSKKRKPSH